MGKLTNTLLRLGLFVMLLLGFTASTAWAQITPADINTGGPGTYSDDLVVDADATIDINGTAVLEGDLTIDPDVTLTLAPGTILEMEDNAVITIGGATIDGEGQLQITTSTGLVEIILTGANPTATIQDLLINKRRGRVEISIFEPTTPGQEGNLTITESLQIVAGTVEANRNFITYQVNLDLFDALDDDEQPVLSIAEDAEISGDRALVLDIIGANDGEDPEVFVAKGKGTLGMLLWQNNAPAGGTTVEFTAIGNGGASKVTAGTLSLPNLATLDGSLDIEGETAVVLVDEDLEISDDLTVEAGGTFENRFATTIGENLVITGEEPGDGALKSTVKFLDEATIGGDLEMNDLAVLAADIRADLAENHLVTVEGNVTINGEGAVISLERTAVGTPTSVWYYNNLAIGGDLVVTGDAPQFLLAAPLSLTPETSVCSIMDMDVEARYIGAGNFVQFFGNDAVLDFADDVLIPSVVVAKDSGDDLEIDDESSELQISDALLIASGDVRTNGLLNLDPAGEPGPAAIAVARRDGARGQLLAGASGSAYTDGGEPIRIIYLGNEGFYTGAEVPGDAEESEDVAALVLGVSAADAVITISRDMTVNNELILCEGQLDVGSAYLTLDNGVNVIVRDGQITRPGTPPFQGNLVFPEIVLREEKAADLQAGEDGIDLTYISTKNRTVTLEWPSKDAHPYVIRDLTINTANGAAIGLREGEDFAIYGDFTSLSGNLLLNGNTLEMSAVNNGDRTIWFEEAASTIVGTDSTGLLLLTGEQEQDILFNDDDKDGIFTLPRMEINKVEFDETLKPVVFAESDDADTDGTHVQILNLLVTSASTVDGVTVLESVENFEVVNDFTLLAGEFQLDPEASDGIEDVCDLYDIVVDRDDDEVRQWVVVGGDMVVNGQVRAVGNYIQVDGNLTVTGVFDGANNENEGEPVTVAPSFTVVVGEALNVGEEARFYLANGQMRLLGDYNFQGEYDVNTGAEISQGARGTVFFEGGKDHAFASAATPAAQLNNVWLRTTGEVVLASDMVLNNITNTGYVCGDLEDGDARYIIGGGELTLQLGVVNSQGADGEDNWVVRLLNPDAENWLVGVNNPGIPSEGAVQLGTRDSYVNGEVERLIAEGNASGGVVTGGYFFPVGSADEQGKKFIAPVILQFATTLPVDTSRSASVKILKTDDPLIAAMNANFKPFDVPGVGGTLSLNYLNPTNVVYRIDFGGIPAEDPNIRVIAGDLINRVDEINALRLVAFDCDGTNPRLAGTYDVTSGGFVDDGSAIENDFINGVPNITMEGVDVTDECMLVTVATDQFINALTPSAVDRALVQIVHAAPNTGEVDIEIEGRVARTGFGYGEATPFLRVVAAEGGANIRFLVDGEAVLSDALTLEPNENYIVVIAEGEEGLARIRVEQARTAARNQEMVEIVAVNAMAPMIDIVNWDAQTVPFNNIPSLDYSRYQPFQPEVINFEIVDQDAGASLNVVRAELGEFTGDALAAIAVDDPVVGPTLLLISANGVVVEQQVVTDAEEASELPAEFALNGNYPNPFNPSTTISFNLPQNADVTVEVVDMLGRRVMTVPVQTMQAGMNRTIQLNATELASGVYLYRVIAKMADQTRVETGRMTLLK